MTLVTDFLALLGARALVVLRALGHNAFFFVDLLRHSPAALRRFGLVAAQIHAVGNYSLLIIVASGLAVGFVLALQMYYALVTYGAAESMGLIVNLACAWILRDRHDHGHEHDGHAHDTPSEHEHDHNLAAAYLHVLADALTSLLAIAALLGGKFFGWIALDAVLRIT